MSRFIEIAVSEMKPDPRLQRVTLLPDVIAAEKAKAVGEKRALHLERAEAEASQFNALVESVCEVGVRERLKVWKKNESDQFFLIADGRHRWLAAKAAGLESVECEVVYEDEILEIILDADNRRHFSKGALAYRAVALLPEVAEDAQVGRPKLSDNTTITTQGQLAKRIGVHRDQVSMACALYRLLTENKVLRAKYESSVWTCSSIAKLLGQVRAESNYQAATGRPELPEPERKWAGKLRSAQDLAFKTFNHLGNTWEAETEEHREALLSASIDQAMKAAPAATRAFAAAIMAMSEEAETED